jgi:hypothetical protein
VAQRVRNLSHDLSLPATDGAALGLSTAPARASGQVTVVRRLKQTDP